MSAEVELANFSSAEGFHRRENAERDGEISTSSIQEVGRDHPSETAINNNLTDALLPPVDTVRGR